MVFKDLDIAEVHFKGEIASRKYCQIFLVEVRGVESGLCAQGIVPQYYGKLDDIDPYSRVELSAFTWDYINPSAIFMEYIPDMEPLNWFNSGNSHRMQNFVKGIEALHAAGVLHQDVRPQNMMTIKSQPDRALWMDFDRSQTYDPAMLNEPMIEAWFDKEREMVQEIANGHDIYYHTL
ncbi:hypothetical protein KEM52_000091 [Ascosphaera acerosa]|nr:hypothetical protein KEM52_000091 [Ascosphaera acerosa]